MRVKSNDEYGTAPIDCALMSGILTITMIGNAEIVQALLDRGAKLTVEEHGKYLEEATTQGNMALAEILERKGFRGKVKKGVMQSVLERSKKLMSFRTSRSGVAPAPRIKNSINDNDSESQAPITFAYNHPMIPSDKAKTGADSCGALDSPLKEPSLEISKAPYLAVLPKTIRSINRQYTCDK